MFEVEIKSLLVDKSGVNRLLAKMKSLDPKMKLKRTSSQLNHYFKNGDVGLLFKRISKYLSEKELQKLEFIIKNGKSHSVRTRLNDSDVIFVLKGILDEGKSIHGIARSEFEAVLPKSIKELDKIILLAGFQYQSKWSRLRQEYDYKDMTVCVDKNAGYGYLAEFEKIVEKKEETEEARDAIRKELEELEIEELIQVRIDRMFEYYNQNWEQYYKTDKTFVIY